MIVYVVINLVNNTNRPLKVVFVSGFVLVKGFGTSRVSHNTNFVNWIGLWKLSGHKWVLLAYFSEKMIMDEQPLFGWTG